MDASQKLSEKEAKRVSQELEKVRAEVEKVFFGHRDVVEAMVRAILCNGHVLLEGVPGIAKTLLIRAFARATGASVKRIQFTVDLLPTDIIGLTTYNPRKGFEVVKGPIFANFVIADEINRSPPKTQ
ncbi:ATPase, partial [Candidatus Pacearchaeota archaeon]